MKDRRSGEERRDLAQRKAIAISYEVMSERGFSDKEVARYLGVSVDVVRRLENEMQVREED